MIIYFSLAGGVVLSVALPLIRAMLPKPPKALSGGFVWPTIRPYIATAVFSLLTALLLMAALGDQVDTWSKAIIAGYMCDSTLQKAITGNTSASG